MKTPRTAYPVTRATPTPVRTAGEAARALLTLCGIDPPESLRSLVGMSSWSDAYPTGALGTVIAGLRLTVQPHGFLPVMTVRWEWTLTPASTAVASAGHSVSGPAGRTILGTLREVPGGWIACCDAEGEL